MIRQRRDEWLDKANNLSCSRELRRARIQTAEALGRLANDIERIYDIPAPPGASNNPK